ncbi:MAG TPA: hotdog fold thioesterase [Candidatus Hydrogenedentes bacterium]|nr:hotdog fold thioesterase [Candidatus Hydrogenedentota bacterium]
MDRAVLDAYFSGDELAKALEMTITEVGTGTATVTMPIRTMHLNGLGKAHGGAIFSLADFCFAVAANSHGQVSVAATVNITFLRPPADGILTARAIEIQRGRRLGTYDVDVTDERGKKIAIFRGTVAILEETLASVVAQRTSQE